MKIDTLEKLEILLFGLHAGKELDVSLESGAKGFLSFGDFNGLNFTIDNSGDQEIFSASIKDDFLLSGCLTLSEEEAKAFYKHIELTDIERGERDCVTGCPAQVGQSIDYDNSYNHQYAKEQIEGSKS